MAELCEVQLLTRCDSSIPRTSFPPELDVCLNWGQLATSVRRSAGKVGVPFATFPRFELVLNLDRESMH
eukprot:scaffold442_cov268-Pinguiococcus_pyrenoidosus.AAC.11